MHLSSSTGLKHHCENFRVPSTKKVTSENKHPSVWLWGPKERERGGQHNFLVMEYHNNILYRMKCPHFHKGAREDRLSSFVFPVQHRKKKFWLTRPKKESESFLLLGMKSRRLILTVIKWRWHGVRWETITPYTSVPNHHRRLKCMQRNCTLRFSRKRFRMLCCCAKKKEKKKWKEKKEKRNVHVRDSFGSTQKRWALNINLFSSPAGDADQNQPYAIMRHLNGWKSALVLEVWITELQYLWQ